MFWFMFAKLKVLNRLIKIDSEKFQFQTLLIFKFQSKKSILSAIDDDIKFMELKVHKSKQA